MKKFVLTALYTIPFVLSGMYFSYAQSLVCPTKDDCVITFADGKTSGGTVYMPKIIDQYNGCLGYIAKFQQAIDIYQKVPIDQLNRSVQAIQDQQLNADKINAVADEPIVNGV